MKIELAELKNKPIQEVVAILTGATPEERDGVLRAIASFGKPPFGFGKVTGFLANELKNPTSAFIRACKAVPPPWGKPGGTVVEKGITPTRRQASKWLNKKGIAYRVGRSGEDI